MQDCAEDGALTATTPTRTSAAALDQIPADLDEYSDCRAVISGSIGNGVPASAAAPKASTAADAAAGSEEQRDRAAAMRRARPRLSKPREAAKKRKRATRSHGARLRRPHGCPRTAGVFEASDTANGLPLPVLLALVALGCSASAAGLFVLGKRNPGFAGALRRVPFPRSRR